MSQNAAISTAKLDSIIEKEYYEGIAEQDGWETLTLTVEHNHRRNPALAAAILDRVKVLLGR